MAGETLPVDLPSCEEHRPERRLSWHPYHATMMRIVTGYLNLLLIFVPLGLVSGFLDIPDVVVFLLNLVAMVPLMSWITFSIGQLAPNIGRVATELLKATLGNAVEMLVGVIALSQGHVLLVQRTLVGSIVCYSLLVLGCCIFVAGCNRKRVKFEQTAMSIMSSLMVMVSISIIVPTTMATFPPLKTSLDSGDNDILRVSHGTAITLFIVLLVFFFFQFKTHPSHFLVTSGIRDDVYEDRSVAEDDTGLALNPWAAGCILIAATLGMVGCAIFLVKCVDNMARTTGISAPFTMIVLVPLLGNATKYATIVAVSCKGQVELALRAIIGSNLRTLLVTFPVLVLVGWILDQPLTLRFDPFDATMFFLAIMVMNYLIQDGKSNYFEGLVLVGTYLIISVAFYIRPVAPSNVIIL